jgi:hypothetical protein
VSPMDRRGFVRSVGATLPVLALPGCERGDTPARSGLQADRLRALAEVVLPRALGDQGRERAVAAFEAWLTAYRPVAERDHGYGTGDITYTGADPAPGWAAQLEALDLEAMQRFGTSFVDLEPDRRLSLARGQLRRERGPLPEAADAQHVAVGLLAWWASTTEALDLCYGVAIGRETCRPLASMGDAPAPLRGV